MYAYTFDQLAQAIGGTPSGLSKAEREGRISRDASGRFDIAAVKTQLAENTQRKGRARGSKNPPKAAPREEATIAELNKRLIAAKAETEELRGAKLAGNHIDREVAERIIADEMARLQSSILAMASEAGNELANELGIEAAVATRIIERVNRRVLIEFTERPIDLTRDGGARDGDDISFSDDDGASSAAADDGESVG